MEALDAMMQVVPRFQAADRPSFQSVSWRVKSGCHILPPHISPLLSPLKAVHSQQAHGTPTLCLLPTRTKHYVPLPAGRVRPCPDDGRR